MEPVRKAYLQGVATGFVTGIAIMTISILLIPDLILGFLAPQDEEERPPVVVSNGSVVLEVPDQSRDSGQKPIASAKKGRFNKETQTIYRHAGKKPHKDKSVDYFEMWVSGASMCATPLTDLKALTIVTTNGEIKVSVKPRVGTGTQKQDLWYELPAAVVAPLEHRIELGDPHKLHSLQFQQSSTSPGVTPAVQTCTFDAPDPKTYWIQIWAR